MHHPLVGALRQGDRGHRLVRGQGHRAEAKTRNVPVPAVPLTLLRPDRVTATVSPAAGLAAQSLSDNRTSWVLPSV